jgi:hypothetical protein
MLKNRKTEILPPHLDPEQIQSIFERIEVYPKLEQSRQVEKILELFSKFRAGLSPRKKGEILAELARILRPYAWAVQVSMNARVIYFPANRGSLSRDEEWGYSAVGALLSLIPYLGDRPRIRRCAMPDCERWIFAVNAKRTFCDGACKQRHYDRDTVRREKRKATNKKNRRMIKGLSPDSGVGNRSTKRAPGRIIGTRKRDV